MFLKTGTYSVWPSRFEPSPRTAPIASLSIPPLLDLSRLSNSALSLSLAVLSLPPLSRRLAVGGWPAEAAAAAAPSPPPDPAGGEAAGTPRAEAAAWRGACGGRHLGVGGLRQWPSRGGGSGWWRWRPPLYWIRPEGRWWTSGDSRRRSGGGGGSRRACPPLL